MRITIVTGPWLPVPAIEGGSVPRMWHGLAEQFAAEGHDVLLMPRKFRGQASRELRNGVQYRRVGGSRQSCSLSLNLVKDFGYAAGILPRLPGSDILVTNDFWLPVFTRLRPSAGAVVVSANRFPKRQYRWYGSVARVVAASSAIEKEIIRQTPSIAGKVRCIPNPLDTDVFVPPKQGDGNRSEKKILFVGRLHPEKGVHILIEAFRAISREHRDATLRIVGPSEPHQGGGGTDYLAALRRSAGGLRVTFSPPEFDVLKLAAIYQEASLFCYPTLAEKGEALPVAPLEAMSTGLPVIVSGLECFDDFLIKDENGLKFNHRSGDPVSALSEKLDEALSNWLRTKALADNGRKAAQRYSFKRIADEFLKEFGLLL